jgi:autotransporter-associated beta strand protein
VTTDWVVLDNRGDTAGATGTDQYNLSGGTLQIRGQYGIANRNASTAFNFTGGVIRNVGTGVNARIIGAGTFNIGSGGTGTPTIDTGAATNAITVSRALTGTGALVKQGAGTLALNAASPAWTGNLSIEAGIVSTNAIDGGLGSFTTAGRTITVRNGATLSLGINNVFGNGVGNANLPALTLEGSTLSSTRYNGIGALTLKDGSTLTQAATDGPGAFEGYQFLGNITVTGTGASTITTTNGRANHLSASTVFQVEDTTGDAATDLVVSAPLKDPSSAFGGAGSLVKSGGGTMELAAGTVSTYTGTTEVEEGLLMVSGSVSGSTFLVSGGVLSGAGGTTGPINVTDGILAPGASIGTLNAGSTSLGANSTFALEINTTALTTDRLAITGNLSLADLDTATLTIADLAPTPFSGAPLQFITYTGVWDGDFFSYAGNVIPDGGALTVGGNTFYLDYDYQGNSVALVPEPTAVLSLLGGLGVLAGVRRRRK